MKKEIEQAAAAIRNARFVIALTGAGVSTESGIPDFRSKGGLWSRFDPMEYGTIGAFKKDPAKVWHMLDELLELTDTKPNKGHLAMARLEGMGLLDGIITQNIDMLHQKAGSKTVVEFHGSIASFRCLACQNEYPLAFVQEQKNHPVCGTCKQLLKPDMVFFDEQIPAAALMASKELIAAADLLLVAGTSCQVTPASSIPLQIKKKGGLIIEINLEPALDNLANITLQGRFATTMTRLTDQLNAGKEE